MNKLRVLVACEYSATVRDAFRARGFDAWSCDLLPTEGDPRWHIQGDALEAIASQDWDLVIAHPPCTYMTNSGVCHLHKDETRWAKLDEAAAFFRAIWDCSAPRVVIENPIMHRYAKERIGGLKQAQTIQPYHFGHLEQKATCLWIRGVPVLKHTTDLKAETMALPSNQRQRLHYLPPSPVRWKLRSTTYQGIADAMAAQFGDYLIQSTGRASLSIGATGAGEAGRKVLSPDTINEHTTLTPYQADSVSGFEGAAAEVARVTRGGGDVCIKPESRAIMQFSHSPEVQAFLAGFA